MFELGDATIIAAAIPITASVILGVWNSVKERQYGREMHEKEWDERKQEQKNRKKELRDAWHKALYSELFISYQKLEGAFIDFRMYTNASNMDMLRSTDKMEYSGPITFSVYDALKAQPISFYQLAEASKLDAAYFRLNAVNNAVNEFSRTSFDNVDNAGEKYRVFYDQFLEAAYVINVAFESNAYVLEKIDKGTLLKDWRKFASEHPKIKEKLSKKRVAVKE
ncbi:MAG: hypothetical protein WCE81_08840 [Halobacteriota archaeon]